jgi:hypothetical protein
MKFSGLATLALLLLPLTLSAQANAVGDWKAVFVGPIGPRPKMVDEITFTIQATPKGFVGTARAASWPGDLDVADVILEGNRLTFTGTGRLGSSGTDNGAAWARCCPKLMFDGTIEGNKMKLTMTWGNSDGPDVRPALPMEATRVAKEPSVMRNPNP